MGELALSDGDIDQLLEVDADEWTDELRSCAAYFENLGSLPEPLLEEQNRLAVRLQATLL